MKSHNIKFTIDDKGMLAMGAQGNLTMPEFVYALEALKARLMKDAVNGGSFIPQGFADRLK